MPVPRLAVFRAVVPDLLATDIRAFFRKLQVPRASPMRVIEAVSAPGRDIMIPRGCLLAG